MRLPFSNGDSTYNQFSLSYNQNQCHISKQPNNNVGSSLAISFKSKSLDVLLCGGLIPLDIALRLGSRHLVSITYEPVTQLVLIEKHII